MKPTEKDDKMQKINDLPKNRLVKLVSGLKKINFENEAYILAFLNTDSPKKNIEIYKKMIYNSLMFECTDIEDSCDTDRAEEHAMNYFKATNDKYGDAELWVYLLETLNEVFEGYGQLEDYYYEVMSDWFEITIKKIVSLKEKGENVDKFIKKLNVIKKSSENIGCGYGDLVEDFFLEHFNER